MVLKFYYDLMSQPSRSVYIFLEVNRIPYESKPIAIRKGEHTREPFTSINPRQLVPVIDDDGFILTESVAILEYLVEKYKCSSHWYPLHDPQRRARINEYNHWHHLNTRFNATSIFRALLRIPMETGKPVNKQEAEMYENGLRKVIGQLDAHFLRDQNYLAGDDISIADLMCYCELSQLRCICKEDIFLSNSKVKQWIERVESFCGRPMVDAHVIIEKVRANFKKRQEASSKM